MAGGARGLGDCALLPCPTVLSSAEALQARAPDWSVATMPHRRGSVARGFPPQSSVCSSLPRRLAVLERSGPRLQASPRAGLA